MTIQEQIAYLRRHYYDTTHEGGEIADTLERLQAQIAEVRSRCDEVSKKPDNDNDIAYIRRATE